jgi:hypothetical protein
VGRVRTADPVDKFPSIDCARAFALAKKFVYTENQLFWGCQTVPLSHGGNCCRCHHKGAPGPHLAYARSVGRLLNSIIESRYWEEAGQIHSKFDERLNAKAKRRVGVYDVWLEWKSIVDDYSIRSYSLEQDRLFAIAGLATKFQAALPADEMYAAGLWLNMKDYARQLIHDLLWGSMKCKPSPRTYIVPSWSWASRLHGAHSWDPKHYPTLFCRVLDCVLRFDSESMPFGKLKDGSFLDVRGPLARVEAIIGDKGFQEREFSAIKSLDANDGLRFHAFMDYTLRDVAKALKTPRIHLWCSRVRTNERLILFPVEGKCNAFRRLDRFREASPAVKNGNIR